jgi:hypothetical protein
MRLDDMIDMLIDERIAARALGHRQNEGDSELLLKLLFEDVRRNPHRYAHRPS